MRKRFRRQLDEELSDEPLINLTPLIDVVFVVLITFMIIAPVLDIDKVELASGVSTEKKEVKQSSISISVHADNSIWYLGKKVSIQELESLLKQERKKHPNTIPQIVHDKKAQFGTYQALKNSLETLGFEQMDVVLKPG